MSETDSFREVPRDILELCKPSLLDICSPDDQIEKYFEQEQQGNICIPNWETIAIMVMDEYLGYHSCDDTLLKGDRFQDDEGRKYPCLNLLSRKVKAKVLQENQGRLSRVKVKETPPRKLDEDVPFILITRNFAFNFLCSLVGPNVIINSGVAPSTCTGLLSTPIITLSTGVSSGHPSCSQHTSLMTLEVASVSTCVRA